MMNRMKPKIKHLSVSPIWPFLYFRSNCFAWPLKGTAIPISMSCYELQSSLIKKCTTTTTLKKARQIHALMLTSTTVTQPTTPFQNNNLLTMYAKCGSLEDARKMFDQMPLRTHVSFNALISAYSRIPNQAFSAIQLLPTMLIEGFRPNSSTFSSLVQAGSSLEDLSLGEAMHCEIVKFGFFTDVCVQTSLLGMYSYCGSLCSSKRIFDDMVDRDAIAWNSVILGFMRSDKIREGFELFCSMVRTGLMPTGFTYSMILNACSRLRDYWVGKSIHAHLIKCDQSPDNPLQNALVDMYSRCGDTASAFYVFRKIEVLDLVSWNSMIGGYSKSGDGEKAIHVFIQLCRTGFENPDEYTFANVIAAVGGLPALDHGKPLHAQVEKAGCGSSVFVGSTLITMYSKNDEMDSAAKIFCSMSQKDVVVWTEMISGYSRLGDGENAIKYFYQMQEAGNKADSFSLSCVLSSCADLATLTQGEIVHCQAVKTGYEEDICVSGSLIDMYAKIGVLQASELVFSTVVDPDLKCWNAMLGGYSNNGKAEEAVRFFDEILKQDHLPDHVTFVSLLSACSHSGLINKGKFFWNYMKAIDVEPGLKHYSCMVSLLSRAGLLNEAEDLIQEAPFHELSSELWRILLSACVHYQHIGLGVHAAEQILSWDAEDSATLIMLSNLYAASGKWDAVAEMRRKIRGMALEKDPGLSWTEITNKITVFSSDDQSHPDIENIQEELHRLQGNMMKSEIDGI